MKMPLFMAQIFFFGTERMIDLDKKEVVSRLKQFKSLTQFDIEL
jgi:hypothetical protein